MRWIYIYICVYIYVFFVLKWGIIIKFHAFQYIDFRFLWLEISFFLIYLCLHYFPSKLVYGRNTQKFVTIFSEIYTHIYVETFSWLKAILFYNYDKGVMFVSNYMPEKSRRNLSSFSINKKTLRTLRYLCILLLCYRCHFSSKFMPERTTKKVLIYRSNLRVNCGSFMHYLCMK